MFKKTNLYQKLAIAALVSTLILIFVGATVRVTGAGMGCPDWPTCWGLLIPPTSAEQIDFESLPIEKFQRKAERMGRDPSTISYETLKADFNPRHVWTEFVNRLFSLPVGFFSLAIFIYSFRFRTKNPKVFWCSFAALFLVLANAIMGARVVYSGLAPGMISLHLALAMLLICCLVYCIWAGADQKFSLPVATKNSKLRIIVLLLLLTLIIEGIMGSQIREMTDDLAKKHLDLPRDAWIEKLETSVIYLTHRSFSWLILVLTVWAFVLGRRSGSTPVQYASLAIVITQMFLGLLMAQVHIYSWVQVSHVGLAAIQLSLVFRWFLIVPKNSKTISIA
ncbi:MAG: heme A synthase [Akkermansiaceae bacterium]